MSRITNDVNQVQQAVSETVGDLIREGLALLGYAVAICSICDCRLALVVVTGAPIVVYPLVRLGQRCAGRTGAARSSSSTCRTSPPKRSPATASSRRSAPRGTRPAGSARAASGSIGPT